MSQSWRTKADVLKDLGEVNGRRTGAEHLDAHVVAGERPPPIHREIPDGDEMSYFCGRQGASKTGLGDSADPDLAGISTMLQMFNDLDETGDANEPVTLYRNRITDEIRISKLNPHAGEYVPGRRNESKDSPKKHNQCATKTKRIAVSDDLGCSNVIHSKPEQNGLTSTFNNVNMFKSKRNKTEHERNDDSTAVGILKNAQPPAVNGILNETKQNAFNNVNMFLTNSEIANDNTSQQSESKQKQQGSPIIEAVDHTKAKEIKEIQEKIKSTIIASSTDNSLQTKRQKNVAIATLLKLGTIPTEVPVKLIKPDYFEKPPTNVEEKVGIKTISEPVSTNNQGIEKVEKELPSTSSSENNINHVDQDSISKVNGWFSSMECPKPKAQLNEPLVMKDCITFKKKTTSSVSVTSISTEQGKQSPLGREVKAFKPSSYSSELLQQYVANSQRRAPPAEDLGARLQRQLRERDQLVKDRMLAKQNAGQ